GEIVNKRFILFIPILTSVLGCSSHLVTNAVWSREPQSIPESAWTRDSDSGLDWLVANDDAALYFSLRIKDRMMQMLIRRAGLKVYLDPTGSTSKDIMVQYPFAPEPREFDPEGQPDLQALPISTDLLWRHGDTQVILNPHLERTPFKARIGMDNDGVMTFLLRLPIDSLAVEDQSETAEVSIGIEFFKPKRSGKGPEAGGRDLGSVARPGGRGRPDGGMPGRGRPGESLPQQEARVGPTGPVWLVAKLALPPP
ncbi:MAG: hypothetical protein HW407_2191, partial [Bacteroidetes bacterium]|nr:hypothetical protein [Bacteroidota bacterium]